MPCLGSLLSLYRTQFLLEMSAAIYEIKLRLVSYPTWACYEAISINWLPLFIIGQCHCDRSSWFLSIKKYVILQRPFYVILVCIPAARSLIFHSLYTLLSPQTFYCFTVIRCESIVEQMFLKWVKNVTWSILKPTYWHNIHVGCKICLKSHAKFIQLL